MSNINQLLEAAREVEKARENLKAKEEAFAALAGTGRPTGRPQPARRPIRGRSGPSVSQRVLEMVLNSGRAGITRRDMVDVIGKTHESAIHSALKQHSHQGRVTNDAGQWVATAEYVASLQTAGGQERQTQPMRAAHPAGGEYLAP